MIEWVANLSDDPVYKCFELVKFEHIGCIR